jgi:hypothetical protein
MGKEDAIQTEEGPGARKPLFPEEKQRLIDQLRGSTAGYSSGTDILLEERRRERERELAKEGW